VLRTLSGWCSCCGTKFVHSISFDLNKIADTEGIVPKPIGFAPAWSPKDYIFVAYVYDLATREILRVIEQPLEEWFSFWIFSIGKANLFAGFLCNGRVKCL
jgi:hypothetical protein